MFQRSCAFNLTSKNHAHDQWQTTEFMPRQHAFPMLSLRSVSMLVLRVHVCEGMDLGRKVFRSWWVLSWKVCHEGLKAMAPREMMVMPVHSQARFQGYLASLLALPESIESIDFWLVDPGEKMDRKSEFAYMIYIRSISQNRSFAVCQHGKKILQEIQPWKCHGKNPSFAPTM